MLLSWNENGLIDQPTFIDYILSTTGRPKLFHIGHSMGCVSQVVLMSERPEYAKKVLASVLIGPPVYMSKNNGATRLAKSLSQQLPGFEVRNQ